MAIALAIHSCLRTGAKFRIALRAESIGATDHDRAARPRLFFDFVLDKSNAVQAGDAVFREESEVRHTSAVVSRPSDVEGSLDGPEQFFLHFGTATKRFLVRQLRTQKRLHHYHANLVGRQPKPNGCRSEIDFLNGYHGGDRRCGTAI